MRQRPNWALRLSFVIFVAGIVGGTALVVMFAQPDAGGTRPTEPGHAAAPGEASGQPATKPAIAASLPRRMPVAGAPGYFVVVNPDGSSFMEDPDGKRTQLAAGEVKAPVDTVVDKVVDRVTQPPKKVVIGQLVVCEKGVVDVPRDAVVTLIDDDRVVTHNPDGSSTVYFTDGKVIRRDRVERKGELTPPANKK